MKMANPKSIDVKFINPFLSAVQETLSVQANCPVTPLAPFLKQKNQTFDTGIAGVLSISNANFIGDITLCFPEKLFLAIYNKMFQEKQFEITDEIRDTVGELLNIIYGFADSKLGEKSGDDLEKAIPEVLLGEKLRSHFAGEETTIVMPFECEFGQFQVEIRRKESKRG